MPHIHELYDFTISTFIVYEGKVLLVNHPRYDLWLPPGGHIELDEDPEAALFREIEEETGYKQNDIKLINSKPSVNTPGVKFLTNPNFINVHEANPPHKHIDLVYFVKASHSNHVKSDEHLDARWFEAKEVESGRYKTAPDIPFLVKEAIKEAENVKK